MSDRGMKKWAPYKSLVEQQTSLNSTIKRREKVDKPLISNEEAEQINNVLSNYKGEILSIKYYRNGKILEKTATIKRIDVIEKKLVLTDRSFIYFSELIQLDYGF